jgi:hypothetical protein
MDERVRFKGIPEFSERAVHDVAVQRPFKK